MKANIEKIFDVEHPVDRVWNFLSNPEKVVTCVPGASITEKLDEQNYKGQVSMKFGPVGVKYNGQITIEKLDEPSHHMTIIGKGMDAKGSGSAGMTMNGILKVKEPQLTEVSYIMEVSVSGKLAQFGSRLIVDVSNQLVKQFIEKFKQELDNEAVADGVSATTEETVSTGGDTATATQTTASAATSTPAKDNSLSVFTILGAIIRGFFARLFGRKS